MIKRTTKPRSNNNPRTGISKAAPIVAEPANIQTPTAVPQPVQAQALKAEVPRPAPVQKEISATKPEPVKVQHPVKRAEPPKAHLELVKPEAHSVFVAGSFNGWNPSQTPLHRVDDGKWVGELSGIVGRHEYLFVVDGQWLPDPNAKESVQNPFGGRNSVLVISA